jgi:hypothetical protein
MFEKYDDRCEIRIRRSFRLPPIFLGQTAAYNFATAFASYVVAEAQVFKPERDAFDEIISMRLLAAMGYDGYRLKSNPLVIEDATLKLQGVEVIAGMNQVEPGDIVEAVNKIVGTHIKVSDDAPTLKDQLNPPIPPTGPGPANTVDAKGNIKPINPQPLGPTISGVRPPSSPGVAGQSPGKLPPPKLKTVFGNTPSGGGLGSAKKGEPQLTAVELALSAMTALRKRDVTALAFDLSIINSLDAEGFQRFSEATSQLAFVDPTLDPAGLAELSACTLAVMAGHDHAH